MGLLALMRGASLEDWSFLAGFGKLRENLNVYNHSTRSIVSVDEMAPWFATWALMRFNRKHRWCFFLDIPIVLRCVLL